MSTWKPIAIGRGVGSEICRDSRTDPYSTDPLIVGDIGIYQAKGNLEIDNEARGCLGCADIEVWIAAERFALQLPSATSDLQSQ
jgi:hypothetical protein